MVVRNYPIAIALLHCNESRSQGNYSRPCFILFRSNLPTKHSIWWRNMLSRSSLHHSWLRGVAPVVISWFWNINIWIDGCYLVMMYNISSPLQGTGPSLASSSLARPKTAASRPIHSESPLWRKEVIKSERRSPLAACQVVLYAVWYTCQRNYNHMSTICLLIIHHHAVENPQHRVARH